MTVALIDGDIVAYRAASARQRGVDWGDGETDPLLDPSAAAEAACQTIDAWLRLSGCRSAIVAFTGRENFRRRILPSYKANRAGKVKPPAYAHVVADVRDRFETITIEGLEADDVLGILLTTLPKYQDAVCLTIDKDLRTVAGLHLNPLKESRPVSVTEAQGDHYWMSQVLTGDVADGYVGIPGIGPKKAAAILGPHWRLADKLWPKIVDAYRAAGLTEADAFVQARVARILRREDYDKNTKEIILWQPATPTRSNTTPLRIPVLSPPVTTPDATASAEPPTAATSASSPVDASATPRLRRVTTGGSRKAK